MVDFLEELDVAKDSASFSESGWRLAIIYVYVRVRWAPPKLNTSFLSSESTVSVLIVHGFWKSQERFPEGKPEDS